MKSVLYFLLVVALVVACIYFYNQANNNKDNSADPNAERKAIVEKVGDLATLPSEYPTIETVTNAKLLRAQSFYEDVKNGDKLLIFTPEQQIIIYRPSSTKLLTPVRCSLARQQRQHQKQRPQPFQIPTWPMSMSLRATMTPTKQQRVSTPTTQAK